MNRSRLLAPAVVVLVAAVATGCGRATTRHPRVSSTPVCSHVTTDAHGDYVTRGHRPCILTTPPPAHGHAHVVVVHRTTVVHTPTPTPKTTPTVNLTNHTPPAHAPAKPLKSVPARTPVHLAKPPAPAHSAPKPAAPKLAKPSKPKK
jgi:hypothetical protein